MQVQRKVQKLKVSRDYSFLSDDAQLPASKKEPPARNVSVRNSGMLLLYLINFGLVNGIENILFSLRKLIQGFY